MSKAKYDFHFLQFTQTKRLFSVFNKHNLEARFVGGCVRDAIVGKNTSDFDIAVKSDILELKDVLETERISVIPTGIKYGSISVVIDHLKFELTSLRTDIECYGRSCKIESSLSFEEDAKRRDFTMNALYVSQFGEVFDYFNGVQDLQKGNVIFIGNPGDRIKEDYLRIFRYYRFSARFCDLSDRYSDVIREEAINVRKLSIERIQKELLLTLSEKCSLEIFKLIKNNGVFTDLDIPAYSKLLQISDETSFELKVYILFGYDVLISKFKLPRYLKKIIKQFKALETESLLYCAYKNGFDFMNEIKILKQIKFDICEKTPTLTIFPQFPLKFRDLPSNIHFAARKLAACEKWWVNNKFQKTKGECLKFVDNNLNF